MCGVLWFYRSGERAGWTGRYVWYQSGDCSISDDDALNGHWLPSPIRRRICQRYIMWCCSKLRRFEVHSARLVDRQFIASSVLRKCKLYVRLTVNGVCSQATAPEPGVKKPIQVAEEPTFVLLARFFENRMIFTLTNH